MNKDTTKQIEEVSIEGIQKIVEESRKIFLKKALAFRSLAGIEEVEDYLKDFKPDTDKLFYTYSSPEDWEHLCGREYIEVQRTGSEYPQNEAYDSRFMLGMN